MNAKQRVLITVVLLFVGLLGCRRRQAWDSNRVTVMMARENLDEMAKGVFREGTFGAKSRQEALRILIGGKASSDAAMLAALTAAANDGRNVKDAIERFRARVGDAGYLREITEDASEVLKDAEDRKVRDKLVEAGIVAASYADSQDARQAFANMKATYDLCIATLRKGAQFERLLEGLPDSRSVLESYSPADTSDTLRKLARLDESSLRKIKNPAVIETITTYKNFVGDAQSRNALGAMLQASIDKHAPEIPIEKLEF